MRKSALAIRTVVTAALLASSASHAWSQTTGGTPPAPLLSDEFPTQPIPALPPPLLPQRTVPAHAASFANFSEPSAPQEVQPASAQLGMSPFSPPANQSNAAQGATSYPYGSAPSAPPSRELTSADTGRLINGSLGGSWTDYCAPAVRACYQSVYGSADAWWMHRNDATWKNIARSATTNGVLGRSRDPDFNLEVIPRLTLGKTFCDWTLEGNAYYKDDIDAHTDAVQAGAVDAVFFGLQPFGSNFRGANRMRINLYDGFHSYEANAINTVDFFNWMIGVRYVEFRERLNVYAQSPTGNSDADIGTFNRMIGAQVGFRMNYETGLTNYQLTVKTGMYHNDAHIGTTVRDLNNTIFTRDLHTGGQNEAYLSELNAMATYNPYMWLTLRAGYQFMYINEIALAPDQILAANDGANTGSIPNAHGDMFMHGPQLGLEMRW